MSTSRIWIGGADNNAGNPQNWSPTGAPQPGDTLVLLDNGPFHAFTLHIRGNDLAGNTLTIGQTRDSGPAFTLNLSDHAHATVRAGILSQVKTKINVAGTDTLDFSNVPPPGFDPAGGGNFQVNLAPRR